uniref:HTH_Tnp_Tc3_1 domain-containing protein n=1 Tax=Heterorhabditis bacteriophora TaxID=37862 RepID=A0A1I7XIE3_HETBA
MIAHFTYFGTIITVGRTSTLSLHERGQNKALSTTGYSVKQIAEVVKCSRKAIMNFLRHQEEYGTKKSSGRPGNLSDREKGLFCVQRRIARLASLESVGPVHWCFKNYGVENAGLVSQYCTITDEEVSITDTRAKW